MTKQKRVLWVDDEKPFLSSYEEALEESGFALDFSANVDEAVRWISDPNREYEVIIWDMSMPTGNVYASRSDADGGFATGRLFLDTVRHRRPNVKTLLFTNFRDLLPKWSHPERGEYAAAKPDYTPSRLVELVKKYVV